MLEGYPGPFPHVAMNEFVVKPKHIHGIVVITNTGGVKNVGAKNFSPLQGRAQTATGTSWHAISLY